MPPWTLRVHVTQSVTGMRYHAGAWERSNVLREQARSYTEIAPSRGDRLLALFLSAFDRSHALRGNAALDALRPCDAERHRDALPRRSVGTIKRPSRASSLLHRNCSIKGRPFARPLFCLRLIVPTLCVGTIVYGKPQKKPRDRMRRGAEKWL